MGPDIIESKYGVLTMDRKTLQELTFWFFAEVLTDYCQPCSVHIRHTNHPGIPYPLQVHSLLKAFAPMLLLPGLLPHPPCTCMPNFLIFFKSLFVTFSKKLTLTALRISFCLIRLTFLILLPYSTYSFFPIALT